MKPSAVSSESEVPGVASADAVRAEAALAWSADIVRPALRRAVERLDPQLRDPALHHLDGGGKGVRGALALTGATAAGGAVVDAVLGAVGVELIHNYSLIHDDIIDNDSERRHRPTVWAAFGTGRAIVVGDALANLAVQLLLEQPSAPRVRAAALLAEATAAMIRGQADDMAFEGRESVTVEECAAMENGKTAALLSCAAAIGAVMVNAPEPTVAALSSFGRHLGMAFQAVDDVLGIWGEAGKTGKPVGSDLVAHKKSLPVVIACARSNGELATLLASELHGNALDRAADLVAATGARDEVLAFADRHLAEALDALGSVSLLAGPADQLAAIARFVTERDR
jgi:geranylgeranyl diphosphate synthase, type I